ncbi:MAG: hypothetical protein QM501_08780 [Gimesia sp.]
MTQEKQQMPNAIFHSIMNCSFNRLKEGVGWRRIIALIVLILIADVIAIRILAAEPKSPSSEQHAKDVPGEGLPGFWQGVLRLGKSEVSLLLKLKQGDNGSIIGKMDIVGQTEVPISSIAQSERRVRVAIDKIGGVFEGQLNETQSEFKGQWNQGGQSFPIVFNPLLGRQRQEKKKVVVIRAWVYTMVGFVKAGV